MFFRIWIVNTLLMAFLIFFSIRIYDIWSDNHNSHEVTATAANRHEDTEDYSGHKKLPESFYDAIVKNNIFSPDRSSPDNDTDSNIKGNRITTIGKKIFLYGVVVSGSYKKALLSISGKTTGQKKQKWMSIGDEAGDIKIADIEKEDVVIKDGEQRYKIFLYDKNKPEKIFNRLNTGNMARRSADKTDNRKTKGLTKDKNKSEKKMPSNKSGKPKYQIINTPFGKILRKIR
jgi:hypothetical protein